MTHKYVSIFCGLVVAISSSTRAQSTISVDDRKRVEEYFQTTLGKSLTENDVEVTPSNVKGFVEIYNQGNVMYFDTTKQLLFIGEIYTKSGESLTKASLKARQQEKLARLPKASLVINGGKGYRKIIEFTDPDCPYCRKANEFLSRHPIQVERHIYFDTRLHPSAHPKIVHILCAPDPITEFQKVYSNSVTQFTDCDAGAKAAEHLQKTSIEMAVSGTPTFFIGDNLVRGFDKQMLNDFLNSK